MGKVGITDAVWAALTTAASWDLVGNTQKQFRTDRGFDHDAFVASARRHRVSGIVLEAVRAGAVTLLPPESLAQLNNHHEQQLRQSLLVEVDLVRCIRRLDAAGIDCRVIKGLATAQLDYQDPAQRVTSDVDILVRRDELHAAVGVLAPLLRPTTSPSPHARNFTLRYEKGLTLRMQSGGWLDLHRMIAPGYWGLALDHDQLFGDSSLLTLAGTDMLALPIEQRFIHAVLHVGCSDTSILQSVRDIPVIAAQLERSPIDVLESPWLRSHRGAIARGLATAASMIELDPELKAWSASCTPARRERIALQCTRRAGMGVNRTGAMALPARDWPLFILGLTATKFRFTRR